MQYFPYLYSEEKKNPLYFFCSGAKSKQSCSVRFSLKSTNRLFFSIEPNRLFFSIEPQDKGGASHYWKDISTGEKQNKGNI